MPIDVRDKLKAVTKDLGSQARVARALGVSPSRVSRWLREGEQPDRENRRKLDGLEFVVGRLLDLYERPTALKWLHGINAHVGHARPIEVLAMGRIFEVLAAIEAEETGAYC